MNFTRTSLRTVVYSTLFRQWMILCAVSLPLELAVSYLLSRASAYEKSPQVFIELMGFYRHSGGSVLMGSLVLGLCQWLVIRRYFIRAYGWLGALAVGSVLTFFWYGILSWLIYDVLQLFDPRLGWWPYIAPRVISVGLGFGLAQGLFFRGRSHSAASWIIAVAANQLLFEILSVSFVDGSNIFSMFGDAPAPSLLRVALLGVGKLALLMVTRGLFTGWVLVGFMTAEKRQSAVRH